MFGDCPNDVRTRIAQNRGTVAAEHTEDLIGYAAIAEACRQVSAERDRTAAKKSLPAAVGQGRMLSTAELRDRVAEIRASGKAQMQFTRAKKE